MKKNIIVAVVLVMSIFTFNGCNGSFEVNGNDELITLYLVDEYGNSYSGVPYRCGSMYGWERTAYNGEFSFYPYENCEFDFIGLAGDYGDVFSDVVRIVDYTNSGKGGIPYDCASFGSGSTDYYGSFDYNANDECVFYL